MPGSRVTWRCTWPAKCVYWQVQCCCCCTSETLALHHHIAPFRTKREYSASHYNSVLFWASKCRCWESNLRWINCRGGGGFWWVNLWFASIYRAQLIEKLKQNLKWDLLSWELQHFNFKFCQLISSKNNYTEPWLHRHQTLTIPLQPPKMKKVPSRLKKTLLLRMLKKVPAKLKKAPKTRRKIPHLSKHQARL